MKKSSSLRTAELLENTQHIFACYFLFENVLCSELIICCYSYIRLRADSKDKANMLIAATKSDESNNIDLLKW